MSKAKTLLKWKEAFDDLSQHPMPWEYFEKVLVNCYGCEKINKDGSIRLFVHAQAGVRFTAHEPHHREPFVSKDDRKRAIREIEKIKEWQSRDGKEEG